MNILFLHSTTNISEHNKVGDVLNVWLQAIPLNGGTPTVGVSPLE